MITADELLRVPVSTKPTAYLIFTLWATDDNAYRLSQGLMPLKEKRWVTREQFESLRGPMVVLEEK